MIHLLINTLLVLIIAGFLVWLLNFLPIDGTFKSVAKGIIIFVVVLSIIINVLQYFHLA